MNKEHCRGQAFPTNTPQADRSQGFEVADIFRFQVEISGLLGSKGKDESVVRSMNRHPWGTESLLMSDYMVNASCGLSADCVDSN